jgi:tetratricopeptide (TPR) repeat protein
LPWNMPIGTLWNIVPSSGIGAETAEQIVSGLVRMAEVLQLPGRDDKDQPRVVAAVQRWLTTHGQWLLIWDNVEDLTLLERFLPSTRSGASLITTRYQALGTLARGLDLLPMEQEEGILLLLRRAKVLEPEATSEQVRQLAERMPAQYAAAADLVGAMGGLPLALDQAGAYLEETRCGLLTYLHLFRTQRTALLQQRGGGLRDHPASVSTTFTMALTGTAQRHPAVWDLLRVCALLPPDAIPEELFRQGAEHLGTTLETVCRHALEWDRVIAVACSSSLLSRQPEEQTLSLHRLVQAVLLETMTETERERWTWRVINALETVFPEAEFVTLQSRAPLWKQSERLLPHARLCLDRTAAAEPSLVLASLAYKTALYLHARGRYAEAALLFQRALLLKEQALGPDHPDVVPALTSLATSYWMQGQSAQAEPLCQRAVRLCEQALEPDHPAGALALNRLAVLFMEQGKYAQAEPLLQRTLHIWEQAHGPDHPSVALVFNNLAVLFMEQGKYAQAEPFLQRALHIWEQVLGPDHYDLALPLENLAELYTAQRKYVEARALLQRALQIREQALEPDHPDMATPLHGLALLFREQGRYAEAASLFERALQIREQRLGQDHPRTAETLHDLALLRQKQGHLREAIALAERALSIRLPSLGDTHPKAVATQALYAQLLQEQAAAALQECETPGNKCEEGAGFEVKSEHWAHAHFS